MLCAGCMQGDVGKKPHFGFSSTQTVGDAKSDELSWLPVTKEWMSQMQQAPCSDSDKRLWQEGFNHCCYIKRTEKRCMVDVI